MMRTTTSSSLRFIERYLPALKEKFSARAARVLVGVCVGISVILSLYMIVMRFRHLTNGFQYDELYSAITASPALSLGFVWKHILLHDVNLPLYNVLLWSWNRFVPFSPVGMHLFSALLGAAALGMAWILAPAYWTKLKKWIYVSLLACSFILVTYGAVVRTYSLSVLLTVVFSLLALRIIDKLSNRVNPSGNLWLAFLGAGLLGSYSHYFCSGLFFITALVVFLYACYYKTGRAWSFWGTAVVFFLWGVWAARSVLLVVSPSGGGSVSWWFVTPVAKATFDAFQFLFGSLALAFIIVFILTVALVLWVLTYKTEALKHADIVLPIAQIVLLISVVALVSLRANLWLERYFLPLLPALFMLLAGLFNYLYKNAKVLLVLWPVLLFHWVQIYWLQDYVWWPEYNGLRDAFTYLTQARQTDTVFVDTARTGYPQAALGPMFAYYVPEGYKLDIVPITEQNIARTWMSRPKIPVLLPLCSQIHMMEFASTYHVEEEGPLLLFHRDTCVFTISPVENWGNRI